MSKSNYLSDKDYKDQFLWELQKYGNIQQERNFAIDIIWKERKYPIVTAKNTTIDLVEALKDKTWYSFFFFEDESFHTFNAAGTKWKKEIYYNKKELNDPGFFISLLHEVGHFPINDYITKLEEEKRAWIKAIQIAAALKNTHNICFLAGFKGHQDIYDYAKKFIKTYEKKK